MNSYFIKDVCSIKGGKRIPKGETLQIEPNGHPYIRILDMSQGRTLHISNDMQYARDKYLNKIKNYTVHTNDVILSIVGTLGLVSVIGPSLDGANLTENCVKFIDIDKTRIMSMFLYYSLISPFNQTQIRKFQVGSMQPKLPMYNIQKLIVPNIPINIQKKIVDVLSSLDSKIENNNKINSELESLARTIYDYWFLQFDFPNEEGKPYKSSGGTMEYNEQLKMNIPKGWEVRKLCEIATITTGKEDANHSSPDGKYPFFTCSHDISRCDDFKFEGKAILIAGNGDFNMKYYDGKFNAYQRTYVIMPNDDSTSGLIYLTILKNSKKFQVGSNGSIEKFIRKGDIENIFVLVPSNGANYRIFNTFLDQIQLLQKENDELSSLRDYLLPLLMNGQVGFKDE